MATLTNHRIAVGHELGMLHANAETEVQTLIDMRINAAVRKVRRDLKIDISTQSVTPGANENYTLASTVLYVDELRFTSGGSTDPLRRVTPAEIHMLRRGSSTGDTLVYAAVGRTLMFFPTPGATDELDMDYVPAPTAMSAGSHDSSNATYGGIPEDYDHLIQWWACHLLASYDDDQSSAQGQRYLDWYRQGRSEARRELARVAGRRLARATRGRRRFLVPTHPSQDI